MGKHGGKTVIQYPSPSIFPQNPAARCISLRLLAHNPINTGGTTAAYVVVVRHGGRFDFSGPNLF
jgi:hypothetical protein